jgi:hypothetical protein
MPSAHEVLESLSGSGISAFVDIQVTLGRNRNAAMTQTLAHHFDGHFRFRQERSMGVAEVMKRNTLYTRPLYQVLKRRPKVPQRDRGTVRQSVQRQLGVG